MSPPRRKILFFAEGATLAHVGRPYVLAEGLDPARFEVVVARPAEFRWLTAAAPFRLMDLQCQSASVFARRLELGLPLYDLATLSGYVENDLALIDAERPDVVVGDFRLSLSVSARLRNIPYATLCDAYWSPECALEPPLPVLPFTPYLPLTVSEFVFRRAVGLAFRLHARPIERLRARHGLPPLGYDLRRCYTDADLRLFANFAALYPEVKPSARAAFVGPLAWSPKGTAGFPATANGKQLIYVTMGSSGDIGVLARLLPVLEDTGFPVLLATAGRALPSGLRLRNTEVHDFLPGDVVCRQAKLVVCNGGSPTTNQALRHGVPVLGIARNMDQFLNMQAIVRFGAGLLIRADRAGRHSLTSAVSSLLTTSTFKQRANGLAASMESEPSADFASHVARLIQEQI
jgi:UDP:flavonoid glycosyltransferase YjiC (YdhE family)